MHVHTDTCKHTSQRKKTIRNFIIAAINCVLLRSGLNVT